MSASNRDLHLTNLRTNLCSNRDVLNFPIVNFPFITSNLPAELAYIFQYVVSNYFHSVKFFLFSSARSRDFDGMYSTRLPVSMYATKTSIDLCRFNVRSSA